MDTVPLDPETRRRMEATITHAIHTRCSTLAEAVAEARGLARGRQPHLAPDTVEKALTEILKAQGAYAPPPELIEHDGRPLVPATAEELADTPAYAMRFNESGKARRTGWEYAAQLAAAQLVRQLQASGFVLMRKPPAPRHTAGG